MVRLREVLIFLMLTAIIHFSPKYLWHSSGKNHDFISNWVKFSESPEDFRGLAGFFSSDWKVIPVLPSSENQIFSVILKTSRGY